jgi:hypothetical protein
MKPSEQKLVAAVVAASVAALGVLAAFNVITIEQKSAIAAAVASVVSAVSIYWQPGGDK